MKILVIRFSSIGDIVLTTPVVRCLKKQLPDCEIHYATKKEYAAVLANNPYIDTFHFLEKDLSTLIQTFKGEKFDYIIDLHNNLRTSHIKLLLGGNWKRFNKLNIEKWLLVNFKINKLPKVHIVHRYMQTVESLGVKYDGKGLDFFIVPHEEETFFDQFPGIPKNNYVCLVPGAKFNTKTIPAEKCAEMINVAKRSMERSGINITLPILILGGSSEIELGNKVVELSSKNDVINLCGKLSLAKSAAAIKHAHLIITADTGLMHIAAAFDKKIISVWGNTVPEFGMYPLLPENGKGESIISEVKGLPCRPCSKIGYAKCPKGHFKCMREQNANIHLYP